MGKSTGKIIASVAGLFFGAFNPTAFGFAAGVNWAAGVMGASLFGNIWAATHKEDISVDTRSNFDVLQNTANADARIPVIYGTRKWGGYETWHSTSGDKKYLTKDVVLCEGPIDSANSVKANNIDMGYYKTTTENISFDVGGMSNFKFAFDHEYIRMSYADGNWTLFGIPVTSSDSITKVFQEMKDRIKSANPQATVNYTGSDAPFMSYVADGTYSTPFSSSFTWTRHYGGSIPGCSYAFHNGSPTQDPPDNYDTVGGYKNCAWIRAHLESSDQLQGSNPTITCVVKGLLVKDTRANTTAYSENPAMCLRDYLLNKRYGLGRWLTSDMIDEDSFRECADYCDEVIAYYVPNSLSSYDAVQNKITALQQELDTHPGYSQETRDNIQDSIDSLKKSLLSISTQPVSQELVTSPRYTLNIVLADKQSHIDDIQQILAAFGGFLVFNGDKISLRMEKDTSVSYVFTDDTICSTKEGRVDIKWETTSLADAPNQYIMKFYDPKNEYVGVKVQVNDFGNQRERGKVVTKEITLNGITSQSQALRLGRMYLAKTKMCYGVCTFSTGTYAMHLQPGDVITITHGILLNQPMRILQTSEENGKWTIKCQQWNSSIYSDYLDQAITYKNSTTVSNAFTDVVPDITSVTFDQNYYIQRDGSSVSTITGTCAIPSYLFYSSCDIYVSTGGSYSYLMNTATGEFTMQGAIVGQGYTFKIIVVNSAGRKSSGFVSQQVMCIGKDAPPSDVSGLTAVVNPANRTQFTLSWTPVTDVDLNHYQINWDGGSVNIMSNTITLIANTDNVIVTVVAVDNSGNVSANPATITAATVIDTSDVTGFTVEQKATDRSTLLITWAAVTDTDLAHYELRLGDTWASSQVIDITKTLASLYQLKVSGYYRLWAATVNAAGHYSTNPTTADIQVKCEPDQPTNLAYTQDARNAKHVILSWTPAAGQDIAGYEISRDGVVVGFAADATYMDTVSVSGTYAYSVRTKTVGGFYSGYAHLTADIMLEPLDVTNFKATQQVTDKSIVRLTWDANSAGDLSHYEIREGSSWDTGTVVVSHAVGTYADVPIREERNYTWQIKAVSSNGISSLYPAIVTGVFSLNPTKVSAIQATQSSTDCSILNIQWTGVDDRDLAGYQVKIGDIWESAEALPLTQELYTQYKLKSSNGYRIMIKTLNNSGFYSDESSIDYNAKIEPSDVTGFLAFQNGDNVELYWNKIPDIDVVGYEVREGYSFDQSSLISTGITDTKLTIPIDTARLYKYYVKAINYNGSYSVSAGAAAINVTEIAPRNVIDTFDEIALADGSMTNVEFGQSSSNFQTIGGRFSDYPTLKFSEVGGISVLKLKKKADGTYYSSGEYITTVIDIGSVITCNVTTLFTNSTMLSGGSVTLQVKSSQNGNIWTAWEPFKPIQRTFRYIQFRVDLYTNNSAHTPEVNQFKVSIDVPDTDLAQSGHVSSGSSTFSYGHTFYTVPYVTPCAIGDGLRAEVVSKGKSSCVLRVRNLSGADVGGNVDVRIKGY